MNPNRADALALTFARLIETRVVFEYDFPRYKLVFTSRLIETRVVFE